MKDESTKRYLQESSQDVNSSRIPHPSSFTPCRLLLDPPASGFWNMAVDEALLESAAERGIFSFRIYYWAEPTVSLGYFQDSADRKKHPASAACPWVRRPTGGGAIVHDREITYSIAVPGSHPLAKRHLLLYQAVHGALIETLAGWDIAAQLDLAQQTRSANAPFLCFQRRAPGDLRIGGTKIVGSAQRRLRGAVLQHGSILWARSKAAPELPGLSEVARTLPPEEEFLTSWREKLAERLQMAWFPHSLSETEQQQAENLQRIKYATDGWNHKRGRVGTEVNRLF
jgi:lipoyl(octanoyl) transferase